MKIAIIGAGKLGRNVADALLGGNHSLTIIDNNDEVLEKLAYQMDVMTVNNNAKDIRVLKQIDINTFDYLLASTGNDEQNILISSFAKKLGCSKVIAIVRDPEHMNQLEFIKETMNIDFIVNPDLSIALETYKYLVEKYTLSNGIFTSRKISFVEFAAKRIKALIGLPIPEFNTVLSNMIVVAISRYGKVIIPHGDTTIHKDDILYVVGLTDPILELNDKVHDQTGKYTNIQKVMIMGGGKVGLYLANKLEEYGVAVKIIERNIERCYYLSAHLRDAMILNGDATDLNLLEEENLDMMDAVIACTGYDEENLLLALTAKKRGIEDVIAKVSRPSYSDLIETMGVDMTLNPIDISASNILRFIQGSKRVISSVLVQGQAEIIEIIADPHMPLVNRKLFSLTLPAGMIIAAIHRGSEAIIPNGETVIKEGDRVIILSLLSEIKNIEKLIRTNSRLGFPNKR